MNDLALLQNNLGDVRRAINAAVREYEGFMAELSELKLGTSSENLNTKLANLEFDLVHIREILNAAQQTLRGIAREETG